MNKSVNSPAIQVLQSILSGLLAGAQMHYVHAQINKQRGFGKLASRMLEEYEEEMGSVAEVINHLRRLGGTIEVKPEAVTIYPDVEEQIRREYELQHQGVAELEATIKSAELDMGTDNHLQSYLDDETKHEAWLKQQVKLIELLGIANYLAKQI